MKPPKVEDDEARKARKKIGVKGFLEKPHHKGKGGGLVLAYTNSEDYRRAEVLSANMSCSARGLA